MTTATTKTRTTKAERMAEFKAHLGAILDELVRMPACKLGSEWHADRCDEARWLAARIEILASE